MIVNKKAHALITLVVFFLFGFMQQSVAKEKEVKAAFDSIGKALVEKRAPEFKKHITSQSVAYFKNLHQQVLYADSLALENIGLFDKMVVVTSRYIATDSQLVDLSEDEYLLFLIDNSVLDFLSVIFAGNVKEVNIEDTQADLELDFREYTDMEAVLSMFKSGDTWKIDLESISLIIDMALSFYVSELNMNENNYVRIFALHYEGKRNLNDIWKPILPKE